MDASEFLATAQALLESGLREADYRSCVSRAYYSAYHTARAAIIEGVSPELRLRAGIAPRKQITHETLISWLKNAADADVKEVGDALSNLRTERVRADYHLWRSLGRDKAEDAIKDADEQSAAIDNLTARRIGEAVAPYLEKIYR